MTGRLRSSAKNAKAADRPIGRKKPPTVPTISDVMRAVRDELGQKAPTKLALVTGASIDACEKWLAGKREPGAGYLISILRDEAYGVGRVAIKTIVAGSDAHWVREYNAHEERLHLRRQIADSKRRLDAIEQGDLA